jgi:hypothetical protein
MIKLLFMLAALMIFISFRQIFLMFRDGSFRARGNRLIGRNAHPVMFLMNFVALSLLIVIMGVFLWMLIQVR